METSPSFAATRTQGQTSSGAIWSDGKPEDREDSFGLVGQVIDGRFLVERAVGRGGFGVVYRVQHLRLDVPVALKVLKIPPRATASERDQFVERFLKEGKLLFRLGAIHPAVVRAFEAGVLTGSDGSPAPYLAMDWLDGMPLDRQLYRMRQGSQSRLELREVVSLLNPIADGLATAHAIGVAHLDVKPGNIFLVNQGKRVMPKLLDFGLAKFVDEDAVVRDWKGDSLTHRAAMTPAYAAPEQWDSQLGPTGPWTDVYALALVCVELLIGRRPLIGAETAELMAATLDQDSRPTPRNLGVTVPAAVETVFLRALSVNPRLRYQDVRDFWREFRRASDVRSVGALSMVLFSRLRGKEQTLLHHGRGANEATWTSCSKPPTLARYWGAVTGNRGEWQAEHVSRHARRFQWTVLGVAFATCTMFGFPKGYDVSVRSRGPAARVHHRGTGESATAPLPPVLNASVPTAREYAPPSPEDSPTQRTSTGVASRTLAQALPHSRARIIGTSNPVKEELLRLEQPSAEPVHADKSVESSAKEQVGNRDLLHHEALRTRN